MTSYLFIVNPNARNGDIGKMWPKVEEEIKNRGLKYTVEMTKEPKHAIEIAKTRGEEFDVVVATGGDGTVNEVANGLYGLDTTFGILPLGNGNDFALGIKLDDDYQRSLDILEQGLTCDLTVGIAKADDDERYFVNIVDTGVGATVSVASFTELKWLRGFLKYYILAFKKLFQYRLVDTVMQIDDQEEFKTKLLIIAVGAGSRFGGGFHILPDNYHFRKDFGILLAENIRKLRQVYLLQILKPGKHLGKKGVTHIRGSKISLKLGRPLPVEVEGEIVNFGATNVSFEVAPQPMRTIVPQELLDLQKAES
jgi:YegS/Rv2252/BmrU family lipid kinase